MMVLSNSVKWSNRTQLWHIFLWKVITNHERTKSGRWVFEVIHGQKTGNNIGEEGTKALNEVMKANITHVNLEFDGFLNNTKNAMMKKCSWKYINNIGSNFAVMSVPVIGNLFRSALQWEPPKQVFNYFTKTWGIINYRVAISLLCGGTQHHTPFHTICLSFFSQSQMEQCGFKE